MQIYLLDYGAGNVRSVVNAIHKIGWDINFIQSPDDFLKADKIIFPGVGAFGNAMLKLEKLGWIEPLKAYLNQNRPFMGICVGMQCLYLSSDESSELGLGIIDAKISKFSSSTKSVPQIGWNAAIPVENSSLVGPLNTRYYFVHSYAAILDKSDQSDSHFQDWAHTLTTYGDQTFVSSVSRGNIFATQFHPEKSGQAGLDVLNAFIQATPVLPVPRSLSYNPPQDLLSRRIIACLDVRTNDHGDLVVTKGDQYDVREISGTVRNLGKPVELATRYFNEGADEITFLNITSFRDCPLQDTPMLEILKKTSESVFVPLTIGGGIRTMLQPDGTEISALEVAGEYFRSGADKVSIGSDAVYISEEFWKGNKGSNAISDISKHYGAQAVVISVDPKRVYVSQPSDTNHKTIKTTKPGPNGEQYCWYQCTVKGGREARDLDVIQLVTACEALGAGEILLNCMDHDGMNSGYDIELVGLVKSNVSIPVIASSGAGNPQHFEDVFMKTNVDAALAAGIFHRNEVSIAEVKSYLKDKFLIRQ
ncbi:hypothetical protein BC833DRAFT_604891 [Globomyces pollinis-pini]|nr:hypothetical protein BC833DRAFT_604891 [Globomyces pollinis-pini]